MNEQALPQDISTEKTVLCSMIISKEACMQGLELLDVLDFYNPIHRAIFKAIEELSNAGKDPDIILITDWLKTNKSVGVDVEDAYISELIELSDIKTAKNISEYCQIIKDRKINREGIILYEKLQKLAYQQVTGEHLVKATQKAVELISGIGGNKTQTEPLSSILSPYMASVEESHLKQKNQGLNTGLEKLNDKIGGLQKTEVIVVAGRPGMGKTSLGILFSISCFQPVLFFSFEMSKFKLTRRIASIISQVSISKIRNGTMSKDEYLRHSKAMSEVAELPIYINDSSRLGPTQIKSIASNYINNHGIKLVIMDYLQLMRNHYTKLNRDRELGDYMWAFHNMAKELDISIVVLSQLSREPDRGQTQRKPRLSDLRESGNIEQDADIVIFPYRNKKKEGAVTVYENMIIIGKNKDGPVGEFEIDFVPQYALFKDKTEDDIPNFD